MKYSSPRDQMQMISGSDTDSLYITHWAYMEAWDGESLPNPAIEATLRPPAAEAGKSQPRFR